MKYLVTFTKYFEYWVEADSEKEAKELAFEEFESYQKSPVAVVDFDDVNVEQSD